MFGRGRNKNSILTTILGLLGTWRWTTPQIKLGNTVDELLLATLTLQQEREGQKVEGKRDPKAMLQSRHPSSFPELFRSLSKTD